MNRKLFFTGLILVVFVLVLVNQSSAQGCAMCKLNSKSAAEEVDTSIGEQINSGILYLLAMPYIILVIAFRKKIFSFFRELKTAGREAN